ncbi:13460_t:CDS:2 [Funneliformis geosporum]|uniref:13460_t:CDS:1 n=1 Tax=Funneliformis geosporum TaxID=1117311 RepID=A0A9W4T116_9GLOM|nr:13460_t:CDS:2 [Funneliformis geosporum]
MHDYKWEGKENLEKVVERIIIDYFEDTELASELKKIGNYENLEAKVEELEEKVKIVQEQVEEVVVTAQAEDIKEKNKKLKSASKKISYLEV